MQVPSPSWWFSPTLSFSTDFSTYFHFAIVHIFPIVSRVKFIDILISCRNLPWILDLISFISSSHSASVGIRCNVLHHPVPSLLRCIAVVSRPLSLVVPLSETPNSRWQDRCLSWPLQVIASTTAVSPRWHVVWFRSLRSGVPYVPYIPGYSRHWWSFVFPWLHISCKVSRWWVSGMVSLHGVLEIIYR